MDFGTSVRTCFEKYFVFSGRATRSEYWWFYLFTFIASLVLSITDSMVFGWENAIDPLSTLFSLAVLLPSLAAASRRLHDIDRSGWWQTIPIIVGLVLGLVFGVSSVLGDLSGIAVFVFIAIFIVALIIAVIFLIVWLATKGTEGPNRYGEDPFDYEHV